jgi:branched-chain amino acid transport system permease protein
VAGMKNKMTKTTKNNFITYLMVIVIFAVVQTMSSTGHLSNLLTGLLVPICVYTIAAISLNLVVGFSGELSLGHAGFMCVGAYSSALFSNVAGDSIPSVPRLLLAILIGAAVAAVFGIIIGIPVLRLRGDYLAIVTLAFGEIIKNLINVLYVGVDEDGLHVATSSAGIKLGEGGKQIMKGALGISGTSTLYKDIKGYFFLIGIILILITLFIVQNLVNSRSGRAIMSTRDNRIAAESVGINVTKYKLLAFTISASLAGVAGVLYAHNLSMLKVSTFDYNMSILILVYVVLGGIGNLRGSIIATIILYALPELLRGFSTYRMLIYAIVLIAMMLFNWAPAARAWRSRILEKFKGNSKKKEAA